MLIASLSRVVYARWLNCFSAATSLQLAVADISGSSVKPAFDVLLRILEGLGYWLVSNTMVWHVPLLYL